MALELALFKESFTSGRGEGFGDIEAEAEASTRLDFGALTGQVPKFPCLLSTSIDVCAVHSTLHL